MPDNTLFPSLDFQYGQLNTDQFQSPGQLYDYGIPQSVRNIQDLYQQISALKSPNPLLQSQGNMISERDFMFPAIKDALSPQATLNDAQPTVFDPDQENLGRYTGSKYYNRLGFIPGADNEEAYGREQSGWNKITNAIKGAWKLAKFQFWDQLKGWGRMVDAVSTADLSKLYTQDDVDHVNNEMNRIMNENPIFLTQHDQNHVFTLGNFANTIQQTGFTLGAIGEIASEELAMSMLTGATGGAAAPLQAERTTSLLSNVANAFRRINRIDETTMDVSRLRKVFNNLSEYTPLANTVSTLTKGAREGESALAFTARGFGSFYRDLREANAAFTEARAESSGTYSQLKQDLTNQLYSSGNPITQEALQKIDQTARQAADANFWTNSVVIGISNRIEFENIFRGMRGASKELAESGEFLADKHGFFQRAATPFSKGFIRTFKAQAVPGFLAYFKNNLTEALQENVQNITDRMWRAYYQANYDNPGSGVLKDALKQSAAQEFNNQGAQTFMAGFLMAAFTNPFTHWIPAMYRRVELGKEGRQLRQNTIQDQLARLNGFFSVPEAKNAGLQIALSQQMAEDIKNKDFKSFQDTKDWGVRSFVRTGIETGTLDAMFERLRSIAGGLSKEEFEKAFNIPFSDKGSAFDYINELERKANRIVDMKENLDFKFENPFVPDKSQTPEEYANTVLSRRAFEEAKWHMLFMQDAHQRVIDRQGDIIRDMQESMKDVPYTPLSVLMDTQKAGQEVKLLRQEASLSEDKKIKAQKEKQADLIEALIPSIEKGNINTKTFTEYVNTLQRFDNKPPISNQIIEDNAKRINDFFALDQDGKKIFSNLQWLVDPKNFSQFVNRHLKYEMTQAYIAGQAKKFDEENVEPIRQAHPNYDITVTDEGDINVKPKEGVKEDKEELQQITDKLNSALSDFAEKQQKEQAQEQQPGPEQQTPGQNEDEKKLETIRPRLDQILKDLANNGTISDQDKEFVNLQETKRLAAKEPEFIRIHQLLSRLPKAEGEKETKPEASEAGNEQRDIDKNPINEDKNAFPYYEESTRVASQRKQDIVPQGGIATIIQEAKEHGNARDNNGDVPLEGGYSYIRGQVTRLLKNFPLLQESFEFAIVKDNPAFYEHVNNMPKDVQEKLGVFKDIISGNKKIITPYAYFIRDKAKGGAPVIVIRDRKTKDFIYFNPEVPGMVTNSKNGLLASFAIDYKIAPFSQLKLSQYLETQPNQELIIKSSDLNVSDGSYFENGMKLRSYGEFMNGVSNTDEASLHVSEGLKDVPWNDPENTRNGGVFIQVGNLNKIKLLPAKLSEIKLPTGEDFNLQSFFERSYPHDEIDDLVGILSQIIYPDVFRPQNQFPERVIVSSEPSPNEKAKYILKLIRQVPTEQTRNSVDSRDFEWVDSRQNTQTILNDLLENRRMNVLKDFHQDISIPFINKNGDFGFTDVNYEDFLKPNLFTNKARFVDPDGNIHVHPVNNYLIVKGLGGDVLANPKDNQEAPKASGPLTGQDPAHPEPVRGEKEKEENKQEPYPDKKMDAQDLLNKLRNELKDDKLSDQNFDDKLTSLKDGIQRALVGNQELQFIRDRFGDHVLNVMTYAANSNYWGYWKNGAITLYRDTQEGVGYHEAWHHFSQMYLTQSQKDALYKEVRERVPELRNVFDKQIEEHLAEQFRKYAQSKGTEKIIDPVRKNIFRKIWDFLVHLFTGKKSLEDYFQDLYQNKLESYRPSINNARWGTLQYGFRDADGNEVFDSKENKIAKDFTTVMMNRAFSSEDPAFGLKPRGISMSTLIGLRDNPKLKDEALQNVYKAVKHQIGNYIHDNIVDINSNPATISLLDRLTSNLPKFFNDMMHNFQLESNVEDVVEQEEAQTPDPNNTLPENAIREEGEENSPVEETFEDTTPEFREGQYSDKVGEFQDKGILAMISKPMRNFILTIPKAGEITYDKDGNVSDVKEYKNEYGLPEICDFSKVINVLGEEMAGIFKDDEMLAKLNSQELLNRLPEVKFIREALPNIKEGQTPGNFATQIIISMSRDFNRVFTPIAGLVEAVGDDRRDVYMDLSKGTVNKIRREWQDNFQNLTEGVVKSGGNNILAPDFYTKNERLLARAGRDEDLLVSNRIKFLANLGIHISERTSRAKAFVDFIKGAGFNYFADSLKDRLAGGQKIEDPLRDLRSPFTTKEGRVIKGESSFINDLYRLESIYSDRIPSNMFRTATGTNKYALMLPNQLNIVGSALKQAKSKSYLNEKHLKYLIDPDNYFIRNSLVMNSLFDARGNKRTDFHFEDYNSVSLDVYGKKVQKQTLDLNEREKMITNFKTLFGAGAIDIMRTGTAESFYSYRLPEYYHNYQLGTNEYSNIGAVKMLPFNPRQLYTNGKPNQNFMKAFNGYFFNLLNDELSVMKFAKVPNSREFSAKLKQWGIFDDIFSDTMKEKVLKAVEGVQNASEIRDKIRPLLNDISEATMKYLKGNDPQSLTNELMDMAKSYGVVADESGRPSLVLGDNVRNLGLSWRETAFLFALNDFVLNVEFSRIVSGVPQLYKEFHKRFKGTTSPGNNMNTGGIVQSKLRDTHALTMAGALGVPFNENIDEVRADVMADDYTDFGEDMNILYRQLANKIDRKEEMKDILAEYNSKSKPVNDGEAEASLDFYRRMRMQVGNWNFDTDEKEYLKEVAKWRLSKGLYKSEEDKKQLQDLIDKYSDQTYSTFPTMKLHYHGPINVNGIETVVQHKYAVRPIIPSVYEGTPLQDMHEEMIKKGRDYITAKSGSKVFNPDPLKFWSDPDKRDQFNVEMFNERAPMPSLLSAYLKEQIKTDGTFRDLSTWSVQLRSLFLSNMFNSGEPISDNVKEILDNYLDTLRNLIDVQRRELYHQFGIREEGDNIKISDVKNFVETLQKQALIQNLNSNIKESIAYDPITGSFTTPLEITTNRQQIIDLINGMIYKKLVRMKINGDIFVQTASTGTVRKGEDELKFYTPKLDSKGNYIGLNPAEQKIAISPHFYPLFQLQHPDGKKIAVYKKGTGKTRTLDVEESRKRLNEAIAHESWAHNDEIEMIGNRIPLQEVNSIEYNRVKEFLPEVFGPSVIVNRFMVNKSGSDFDNDKIHIIRPSYGTDGKMIGEEAKKVYEKALSRLQKLQQRNDALSSLIQAIYEGNPDDREDEIDMQIDSTPMSDEDRNTINAYKEAKRDLVGYYTNQALMTYKKALSANADMFMQLIRPNSDQNVKRIAIDMAERSKMPGFTKEGVKVFKNSEIYEYPSNMTTFSQNKIGKRHLAVYAVLNRIMQNLELTGVRFNKVFNHKYYAYGTDPETGYSYRSQLTLPMSSTMYLLTPEERKNLSDDQGRLKVGSSKDAEGNIKQHIDSELMNATVDIEKNPYYNGLGINQQNVGVAAILLAANVPLERISAFLHQPILEEYYRRQTVNPYFFDPTFMDFPVRATNRNAVVMLGLKNRRGGPAKSAMLERYVADIQNNKDKLDYDKIFNLQNLLENISKGNWNTKQQHIIFGHYLALTRMQRLYMKMQQAVTVDVKKISSPIGAEMFGMNIDDLRKSSLLPEEDLTNLQKGSYTAPFRMDNEIKKIFESLMPMGFSEKFVKGVAEMIKKADLIMPKDQSLRLERTIANDYMIYVALEMGEYKDQKLRDFVVSQLSKKISTKTLARELTEMKDKYPDVFRFFGLAGNLHENVSRLNPNLQNISLSRGMQGSTETQDVLINEFNKLVNFTGREVPGKVYTPEEAKEIREMFQKIAVVAFGQSGFNKSLFYMTDILPLDQIQPLLKNGLNKYKDEIKKDPKLEDRMITSFLREFPKENPVFNMTNFITNREPQRGKYLNKPFNRQMILPGEVTQQKVEAAPAEPVYTGPKYMESGDKIITRKEIQDNPKTLYLFGDNLQRTGLKGQAEQFRGEPNSIGIATKRRPAGDSTAFFRDADLENNKKAITEDINKVITAWNTGKYNNVVVPRLGVGLAQMDKKAPLTFQFLQQELKRLRDHIEGNNDEGGEEQAPPVPEQPIGPKTPVTPEDDESPFKSDEELRKMGINVISSTEKKASEASNIYSQLGNKTESGNVRISPWNTLKDATSPFTKVYGIIAHIISTRIKNSNEHFGNPFSSDEKVLAANKSLIRTGSTRESVEKYIDWVLNSNDQRAQWIREQLERGDLKDKPIFYYKELGEPSHATALDYLINKYNWENRTKSAEDEVDDILKQKDQGCES